MKISFIEIQNFRKLRATYIGFHPETTLFVGANNSGKTSAMLALPVRDHGLHSSILGLGTSASTTGNVKPSREFACARRAAPGGISSRSKGAYSVCLTLCRHLLFDLVLALKNVGFLHTINVGFLQVNDEQPKDASREDRRTDRP